MGFLSKMFGTKVTDEKTVAEPLEIDFVKALSMHLRNELDPALSTYLRIAEHLPDDNLAPFLAAAIKAAKGNTVEAAEDLRVLSQRISSGGETISRAVSLELVAVADEEPLFITIPAVVKIIVSFGDLLKEDGYVQESAVCFEIATGLAPDRADVLHKFGDTLHDLRIYDYAESVLLEALRLAPNHWGALYTYAVLLQDLGRDEEALTFYEKAVRFNPDHAKCQNNYGAALMRTNRLQEALDHCTLAAGLDPGSPYVKLNLGNIHLLMQEYELARTSFSEAISLNEDLAPAYFGLGSVERLSGGDPGRVREFYLKAIELNPSVPEFHHSLGTLLAGDGNPQALAHFSAAIQLNGNLKDLHKDFGIACLQFGHREEAVEHLRIALKQKPDDIEVQDILAGAEGRDSV